MLFLKQETQSESERTSIYRSLVTNTSKEMMCFSDFPMPADYPNYLHNAQLLQYYRLYADHFGLRKHIRFQVSGNSFLNYRGKVLGSSFYLGVFCCCTVIDPYQQIKEKVTTDSTKDL